jgi:uncharacterized lipoprotein YmbA
MMRNRHARRARRLVAGLAAAWLWGCASPNPHYFTLQPVPGPVRQVAAGGIEVRRPGLAGYLDRADIVLRSSGYRLQVNTTDDWAEPLGDMIGRVVTQDLAQRLPGSGVYSESGAISADPALRVEIDVQRFDAGADGTLTLTAAVAIERGIGHVPVQQRTVTLSAPLRQPGAAGLAAEMSALLGQLADRIAADIADAARLAPMPPRGGATIPM